MKYVLELEMESEEPPTQTHLVEAVQAAAKKLPGQCNTWGLRGSKHAEPIKYNSPMNRSGPRITSTERR